MATTSSKMKSAKIPILIAIWCGLVVLPSSMVGSHWELLSQAGVFPAAINLSDPKTIAQGDAQFAKSCSVGYCHGVGGRAGRGPRLRGREWDKNYLFRVTYEGIPNSSMPAWKGRLTDEQIGAIVAYVMSLSKLTSDAAEVHTTTSADRPGDSPGVEATIKAPTGSPSMPTATGTLAGSSKRGKELFFDAANDLNCGHCHKVRGDGGDVGPDLSAVQGRSSRELLQDIVLPSAKISPQRQLLKVICKDGEQIRGLKVEESPARLKIFDVGSVPPVLRSFERDQIETMELLKESAMPAGYGQIYTFQQLLDLLAFLKEPTAGNASLSAQELF